MKLGGVKGSSYEMMSSTEAWDMGVSYNGVTKQPLVFLLKMIILGRFGGTTS